ncbi:MAG: radical SAM protein [Clostridiales bacterium]
MLIFNDNVRLIKRDKDIVVANLDNNKWIKTSRLYYEVLEEEINLNGNIKGLITYLGNSYKTDNIKKLLKLLIEFDIVKDKSKSIKSEELNIVYLSITNRCNLNCKHCLTGANIDNDYGLNTEQIKMIINEVIELNPKMINFTGGEPLIREDIIELIEYTSQRFNGKISLSTNSILLTDEYIKKLTKVLHRIDISLDGYDEKTCSYIRGEGVFEKVIENVIKIKKTGFNGISLSMLDSKITENEIHKFRELCADLGVKSLIRRFAAIKRGWNNKEEIIGENYEKIEFINSKNKLKCKICKPGQRELMIDSKGDIYPCAMLQEKQFKIDNMLEKKVHLKDIIEYFPNSRVSNIIELNRPYNSECKDCKVNLFCWSCIGNYLTVKKDKDLFRRSCANKKSSLSLILWDID